MEEYVGLKKEGYEKVYNKLKELELPLTKIQEIDLNNSIKSFKEEVYCRRIEYQWIRDTHFLRLFSFVQKYRGKLLYRIFAVGLYIDLRKKNPITHVVQEVYRALEGYQAAIVKNIHVWVGCGYKLDVKFSTDKFKTFFGFDYFNSFNKVHKYYSGNWHFEVVDYIDRVWNINPLYKIEDLYMINEKYKYSQIGKYENPIINLGKYTAFPGIEMLKKCGFCYLYNSKLCLNRLNKNDKKFMKFLYQCYLIKKVDYKYNFYLSYYKKYGLDMQYLDDYVKGYKILNNCYLEYFIVEALKKNFDYVSLSKYLTKNKVEFSYYVDYLKMVKKLNHDLNDPYWLQPNSITKMHDKVMEEMDNITKCNSSLRLNLLTEVLLDMKKYNNKIDGYDVFISDDIEEWKKQCDTLYACLIKGGYINEVVLQKEILVFIWKNGVPVATAQVYYAPNKTDGKKEFNYMVGQFYGDEHNGKGLTGEARRKACEPSEEVYNVFKKWFATFKPVKRKYEIKKKFFKGFYDKKDDGSFVGYGGFVFDIGKSYETSFDDEIIIKAFGKGCNATDKVFHFCDSIEEISKHYSPKYYCEVMPLGPVVEYNGALLSNKIKILKEVVVQSV